MGEKITNRSLRSPAIFYVKLIISISYTLNWTPKNNRSKFVCCIFSASSKSYPVEGEEQSKKQ